MLIGIQRGATFYLVSKSKNHWLYHIWNQPHNKIILNQSFETYLCVVSLLKFEGKLMMVIASKGHFFTQIPQPIHNSSEMEAIFTIGVTSIHSFPIRTTGQDFLHSCRHLLGLHLSLLTIAILVWVSVSSAAFLFNFGGILKQKSCGNCQFCRCSTRVLFRETAYS